MTDAFSANMGKNAPFWKALKEWNAKNKLKSWCVPARGTPEYWEVMEIMREKYAQKKKKKTGSVNSANRAQNVAAQPVSTGVRSSERLKIKNKKKT